MNRFDVLNRLLSPTVCFVLVVVLFVWISTNIYLWYQLYIIYPTSCQDKYEKAYFRILRQRNLFLYYIIQNAFPLTTERQNKIVSNLSMLPFFRILYTCACHGGSIITEIYIFVVVVVVEIL